MFRYSVKNCSCRLNGIFSEIHSKLHFWRDHIRSANNNAFVEVFTKFRTPVCQGTQRALQLAPQPAFEPALLCELWRVQVCVGEIQWFWHLMCSQLLVDRDYVISTADLLGHIKSQNHCISPKYLGMWEPFPFVYEFEYRGDLLLAVPDQEFYLSVHTTE